MGKKGVLQAKEEMATHGKNTAVLEKRQTFNVIPK